MAARLDDKKAELIGRLTERLRGRTAAEAAGAAEFLRLYYRGVPPEDLVGRDPQDLYGGALAHLRFGAERRPDETLVRVYNPSIEQHGWQSTHTIVEVVTDDMPFLVDSTGMAMTRLGLITHLVIHPVAGVGRDASGRLEKAGASGAGVDESFMHVEVDRRTDPARLEAIEAEVRRSLDDVRAAVRDWRPMLERADAALADLDRAAAVLSADEVSEAKALLAWIADRHFTFQGYAAYDLIETADGPQIERVPGSALGILRSRVAGSEERRSRSFAELPLAVRREALRPIPLVVTKANARSTVHRPAYLDYIGVRRFNASGEPVGEHRFLGLFTSTAYNSSPAAIPLLRRKVRRVVERSGIAPLSHDGKALVNILETYPRDELFQTDEDDLLRIATGIVQLQERQRLRLFTRFDPYGRFVACLVFVPRERYTTILRRRMQDVLKEAYGGGEVEYQVELSESVLARILFTVRLTPGAAPEVETAEVEAALVEAARSWSDVLRAALIEAAGEEAGNRLFRAFGEAASVGYQERVPARAAVPDVRRLDRLAGGGGDGGGDLDLSLYRPLEGERDELRLKMYRADKPVTLSDALPMLENMGLRVIEERGDAFRTTDGRTFWVHDFGMRPVMPLAGTAEELRERFHDGFARVWRGEAESDGFNRLILGGGLAWKDVRVLRAYCRYQLQVGSTFSQAYIEQTLASNPGLAAKLAALFAARFDPTLAGDRAAACARLTEAVLHGLEDVANLDEDRILRRYLRTIEASLRTNAYQEDEPGEAKPYLSIKLDPGRVPGMPLPRPAFEIFVYSPRAEGVHLRGGAVARGGIRWSDRREDFRTEVLGLMKAQMVKNAVIVPVGAKGGFVVKRPPADRDALREEVVACYTLLIRGLLDLTDNRRGAEVVPPPATVRHDGDDPYLVVAADKGTATFSDIANGVSAAYGYWLGDAFASGGSAGYDHKAMGITAKGAWESVRRHFYEAGRDCQTEPFTCAGVGDMSGDVFGNGLLLSRTTRLIAAFDHRHIFIDPDPDAATSFAERERLFALPRSSWDDYDRALISKGGGVWPRTLKAIPLSDEARAALGLDDARPTPQELMRAILKAPVDLFWNGGIGTFVKAAAERNGDVQDRANDAIRVDAEDLRCRIIGEGGNLGLTQLARIAFAKGGGRVNSDAIDNSAGVDCSDHEVNIKILLDPVVAEGDMTPKQRNALLAEMTDEIADLVLRDNVLQVRALSAREAEGPAVLDAQSALMRRLEQEGRLNREIEFLPGDPEIAEHRASGRGLARPNLAVLMAYAKTSLYAELVGSGLPDDPYFADDLVKYFPRALRRRFRDGIEGHRLRREIVATQLANSVVNRGLDLFADALRQEAGTDGAEAARAYVTARDAFRLVPLWGESERMETLLPAEQQTRLLIRMRDVLAHGARWFLRNLPKGYAVGEAVGRFGPGVEATLGGLDDVLDPERAERLAADAGELEAAGVEPGLARRFAALPYLVPACDVVEVAKGGDVARAAGVYFAIEEILDLDRLRRQLVRAEPADRWERLALAGLSDDLMAEQRRLSAAALAEDMTARKDLRDWLGCDPRGAARLTQLVEELEAAAAPGLPLLTVAIRGLGALSGAARRAVA